MNELVNSDEISQDTKGREKIITAQNAASHNVLFF